jgi:hypothetical protein
MEKLVVKPFGGLANRLLVLDSVMKLRKLINPKETIIIWERNENLNCKFSHLFKVPEGLIAKETFGFKWHKLQTFFQIYNSFDPSHYRWTMFNKSLGRERICNKVIYANDMESHLNSHKEFYIPDSKSLYISFYQRFISKRDAFFNIQLNDQIEEKVKNVSEAFYPDTIGVHIRRADHKASINQSPTSFFIKKMNEYVDKSVEARFFLATDSVEEKNALVRRFGQNIITREITYSRKNTQGIEDALIDMFCLSKTNAVWGSYDSTFSQVASELGGIQLHVLNKDENVKR